MSSKGVLGIQCLTYRYGFLRERVEQRETALSVRLAAEPDSHFTKQEQNMQDFVEGFPYAYTEVLVSIGPLVRAIRQLITGQAQFFQPALHSLCHLLAKWQIQSKLTWLFRIYAEGTSPGFMQAFLFVTPYDGFCVQVFFRA